MDLGRLAHDRTGNHIVDGRNRVGVLVAAARREAVDDGERVQEDDDERRALAEQ